MIDHDAAIGIDLAVLLMATGDHDEAIDRCRAAAKVPAHRDRALLHLGYALLAAGRDEEAVVVLHDVGGTAPFAERARDAAVPVARSDGMLNQPPPLSNRSFARRRHSSARAPSLLAAD